MPCTARPKRSQPDTEAEEPNGKHSNCNALPSATASGQAVTASGKWPLQIGSVLKAYRKSSFLHLMATCCLPVAVWCTNATKVSSVSGDVLSLCTTAPFIKDAVKSSMQRIFGIPSLSPCTIGKRAVKTQEFTSRCRRRALPSSTSFEQADKN